MILGGLGRLAVVVLHLYEGSNFAGPPSKLGYSLAAMSTVRAASLVPRDVTSDLQFGHTWLSSEIYDFEVKVTRTQ